MVGIRWVYYELEGRGKKSFIPFVLVCVSLCIFCVWLHSGDEPIIKDWLNNRGRLQWTYHTLVWDFFCTLWAVLEGFAMIYSFSIYYLIKKSLTGENKSIRRSNAYGTFLKGIIIVLLTIVYILYHYYAFGVYSRYNLKFTELSQVLTFYRRIIGLFWVTFEGTIAILLFKICSLLNRTKQGDLAVG
ncbi:MAG: hypothetical protein ACFFCW_21730 [Candidatus Hodarchaeota archaeon]